MKQFLRRSLIFCILLVLTVVIGFVQTPSQTTYSAVVFSNMPAGFSGGVVVYLAQTVVVIFDVPVGPDYQINAVNIVLTRGVGSGTVKADIHADGGTVPGPVVVDLGSHFIVPPALSDPFTPLGPNILQNGRRYWLVLTSPGNGAAWLGVDTVQPPTGVFTFVDNGTFAGVGGVIFQPEPYRFKESP